MSIRIGAELAKAQAAGLEPADLEIQVLSILCGKPPEYFEAMEWRDLKKWSDLTQWMAKMPVVKYTRPFTHGLYLYKFKTGPSQLSKDQYVMLSKLNQEDLQSNLHKTMAILTTKYNRITGRRVEITNTLEEFNARSELFLEKMSYVKAYAYAVFFSAYYPNLLRIGLSFSQGMNEAIKNLPADLFKDPTP